jgi:hypothetical protein
MKMRLQPPMIGISQINRQQIAQAAIDLIKIQARAIARDMGRASGVRFGVLDRPNGVRALHGVLLKL